MPAASEPCCSYRVIRQCFVTGALFALWKALTPRDGRVINRLRRRAGATLMSASEGDYLGLNRVLGLGIDEPLTPSLLDEILDHYRSVGVTRALFQLCPTMIDAQVLATIESRGLRTSSRHAKLW